MTITLQFSQFAGIVLGACVVGFLVAVIVHNRRSVPRGQAPRRGVRPEDNPALPEWQRRAWRQAR